MNQIFKMREKSKKSTKPLHEPNFLNWTKREKSTKPLFFNLFHGQKKRSMTPELDILLFLFSRLEKPISFFWATAVAIGARNETTLKLFYTHSDCLLIFSATVFALPVNHFFACRQYFVRRKP